MHWCWQKQLLTLLSSFGSLKGALIFLGSLSLGTNAYALSGSHEADSFSLTRSSRVDHKVFDSHLLERAEEQNGFGLTHFNNTQRLVGQAGLTPVEILTSIAPHLERARLSQTNLRRVGQTTYHDFQLMLGDFKITGAEIKLSFKNQILKSIWANLPEFKIPNEIPTQDQFIPIEALGFGIAADSEEFQQSAEPVIFDSGGFVTPAWHIERTSLRSGENTRYVIDAQTGAIFIEEPAFFGMAHIFPENSHDPVLETVVFPDLIGNGYLESEKISVFAPDPKVPRVFSKEGLFEFDPYSPAQSLDFDQVQAYYNAARINHWFESKFAYSDPDYQVQIRVNDSPGGNDGNSTYTPAPNGPIIRIGRGNSVITNLARDSDVIAHEFAHHVIFDSIKIFSGPSLELHEGFADYFTYAFNDDPYLGETIVVGSSFLRTGIPEEKYDIFMRYDDPVKPKLKGTDDEVERKTYVKAEIWSALLWKLRSDIGEKFDDVVFHSLAALGRATSYKEAIIALLNTDAEIFPIATDAVGFGTQGSNFCLILNSAIERGYAVALENIDGSFCGFDLIAAAQKSRDFTDARNNPDVKSKNIFSCATLTRDNQLKGHFVSWLLFLLPVGLSIRFGNLSSIKRARKVGPYGS